MARPVVPEDTPFLYPLFRDPRVGTRLRLNGATPSPEEFSRRMWDGVLGQWLVEGKSSRRRIGIVTVASPDFVNGFAFLSIARSPDVTAPAVFLDGVGAVLQFVFECWPFRRLYAEVTSGNLAQFERAVGDLFEVEGVRRNQYFMHGEFQDVALLTMTRERWLAYGMSTRRRLLKHAKPSCS